MPGKVYESGDIVTRGGLWIALEATSSTPGSAPADWKLILKELHGERR
jgi:hypothetical protein